MALTPGVLCTVLALGALGIASAGPRLVLRLGHVPVLRDAVRTDALFRLRTDALFRRGRGRDTRRTAVRGTARRGDRR